MRAKYVSVYAANGSINSLITFSLNHTPLGKVHWFVRYNEKVKRVLLHNPGAESILCTHKGCWETLTWEWLLEVSIFSWDLSLASLAASFTSWNFSANCWQEKYKYNSVPHFNKFSFLAYWNSCQGFDPDAQKMALGLGLTFVSCCSDANPSPNTVLALLSAHWPNFWEVFVKVMLGVIVLLIITCWEGHKYVVLNSCVWTVLKSTATL